MTNTHTDKGIKIMLLVNYYSSLFNKISSEKLTNLLINRFTLTFFAILHDSKYLIINVPSLACFNINHSAVVFFIFCRITYSTTDNANLQIGCKLNTKKNNIRGKKFSKNISKYKFYEI